jgi:aminoglycoside 3-N-acetyltransferase
MTTLADELRAVGLAPGATVMVHASLRRLGPVPGRAAGVLDALRDAVGPAGTLVMVLGADADDPFDALQTPVDIEDMGVLAEVFRTHSGVEVSDHALARYAAWGPGAPALLRDPVLHDYHGPGSVLERLVGADGQVLRLGADIDTLTLTHYAEYRAKLPYKRRVTRRVLRADIGEQSIESLDDDDGIVGDGAYFERILEDYLVASHARAGRVGQCTAELIDAAHFVDFAAHWLEREFNPDRVT